MDALSLGLQVGVPVALLGSLLVVRWLDRPRGRWSSALRSRLLMGIPWGSLLAIALVLFVYLVVQQGLRYPNDPLAIPFTSWSYFDPVGVLMAPFSHQNLGHITGNLLGTVALAPLAEYAFSHFPTGRGSHAFGDWRTNPYVRAFVVFPLGVVGVGLLTSTFAWGPIIGFSGVVFAFGGFALVRYPLATVVALTMRDLVGTVYYVLRNPIITGTASPSFGPPWWAGIAIQGHLFGFLVGVVLGAAVLALRGEEERPSALRLWTGGLLVASSMTLWAVWWYQAGGGYILYRGPGFLLVAAVAVLVAIAVRTSDTAIVGRVTRRQVALAVLVVPILTMGFVAVPLNATVVNDPTPPGQAIHLDGYMVTYAEDVTNERVGAIDLSMFGETTQVNASGVIVIEPNRTIWTEAVSKGSLAYDGERTVRIGGVGWSRSVAAIRRGWTVTGGETAYQVALQPVGDTPTWVFESKPKTADPTIAGENVTVQPVDGHFYVLVTSGTETLGRARMPENNSSVTLGDLTLTNVNDERLVATHQNTRVEVAKAETYE